MKLYREEGVNPLGGCLPLLLQMPFFFAFYHALINLGSGEMAHPAFQESFLWVENLSQPDVLGPELTGLGFPVPFLLPLLAGGTQWVQQRMMTTPSGDPQQRLQQQMMMFMPLMIIVIGVNFGAGLALYWVVQNVFGIVQQYFITGWGALLPNKSGADTGSGPGTGTSTAGAVSRNAGADGPAAPTEARSLLDWDWRAGLRRLLGTAEPEVAENRDGPSERSQERRRSSRRRGGRAGAWKALMKRLARCVKRCSERCRSWAKRENEVDVTVVSRGSPPQLLAFGAEPAQVRVAVKAVTMETPEPAPEAEQPAVPPAGDSEVDAADAADADLQGTRDAEFAQMMLAELLNRMGLVLDIQVRSIDPVTLNAVGPGVAELIGRRGTTLHALQFVLSLMVNNQLERRIRLVVDADGYRQRREGLLESMAERLAQRVRVTRQQMVLEPMPPNERRIVHLVLVDDPDVTTESEGTGDNRRVVIKPR